MNRTNRDGLRLMLVLALLSAGGLFIGLFIASYVFDALNAIHPLR